MSLDKLFQRTVQMHPERPALALGKDTPLTYAELDVRVRALAQWLQHDLGLRPGDRVTLAMTNCPAYAEAMLAIWHAKLCAVPINSKLHVAEINYILSDSGSRLCLSQGALYKELSKTIDGNVVHLIDVNEKEWKDASGALQAPIPCDQTGQIDQAELAWIFYTSGTTGKPKGVMLTHANLIAMALNFHADMLPISKEDVLLHVAPMSHGSGLYGIPYWMHGGLQVIPDSGGLDETELFGLLRVYENASLFASPTIIKRMVDHASADDPALPGLRCLLAGGAPFYAEDIKSAVNCFGPRVAQMYGQGETPMTISALSPDAIHRAVLADDESILSSVGYAQTSIDIQILDEDDRPCPVGDIGEVVVRGPTVMHGYWNNAKATSSTLVDGALRTGDIGMIDARGLLHLKDRSKDVIISGGTNIYPREVEEALLHHPHVEEVAVIGMPDPEWGEAVTAILIVNHPIAPAALDAVCMERIARFKRPKRYVFVPALPKNATGKVLKTELRYLCSQSADQANQPTAVDLACP